MSLIVTEIINPRFKHVNAKQPQCEFHTISITKPVLPIAQYRLSD